MATKRKKFTIAERYLVWNREYAEIIACGSCPCCGECITQQSFEIGHIIAKACNGSDDFDNLKPVCRACNSGMRTMSMHDYINKLKSIRESKMEWQG